MVRTFKFHVVQIRWKKPQSASGSPAGPAIPSRSDTDPTPAHGAHCPRTDSAAEVPEAAIHSPLQPEGEKL